jgi:AcrR family transcriptional regulator
VARGVRKRRSPNEAEAEIVGAARELLKERPYREVNVNDLMALTTLSRPSFYQYFPDLHQVVVRVMDEVGAELLGLTEVWLKGEGDPVAEAREALRGLTLAYSRHRLLLRAAAAAAATDPAMEQAYGALLDRFVEATAARIQADKARGLVHDLDPVASARALVLMTERVLLDQLGRPRSGRPEAVVEPLLQVWIRTLYLRDPAG